MLKTNSKKLRERILGIHFLKRLGYVIIKAEMRKHEVFMDIYAP